MSQLQQVRKGSTTLLILSMLSKERMYGYQIMRELERRSDGYFTMTAALLYPTLHQLEQDGYVTGEWEEGEGSHKRKYYTISSKGRKAVAKDEKEWRVFVTNLYKFLQASTE
jgi:PadR family transcriptional regulator PadR